MAMLTLSNVLMTYTEVPEGIVKDHYNHIIGITFRSTSRSKETVMLPIVDDGVITILSSFRIGNIYLDIEDLKPAPVEEVVKYYRSRLAVLFHLYPGYEIQYIVTKNNEVVAVQLQNGIYIPAKATKTGEDLHLNQVEIEQFEWDMDKEIVGKKEKPSTWKEAIEDSEKPCDTMPFLKEVTFPRVEELYQQFRLMISNWITNRETDKIRKEIEEIIFSPHLPEYEKRKRLFIYVHPIFDSWFYKDPDWEPSPSVTMLRKDCRIYDASSCSGTCKWKQETKQCLLHIDETTELGDREVNMSIMFIKKAVDELIRFPNRRKQLMNKGVSFVSVLDKPIREGDQYIIPESSAQWSDLLRLEWTHFIPEEPQFYEEQTSSEIKEVRGSEIEEVEELMGKEVKYWIELKNKEFPLRGFMNRLGITYRDLGLPINAVKWDKNHVALFVQKMSLPVGIIDLSGDVPEDKDQEIYFMKPSYQTLLQTVILLFLPNEIALVVEKDGYPYVSIDKLPIIIRDKWNSAEMVEKLDVRFIKPIPTVPVIIGQNPPQQKSIPLVHKASRPPIKIGPRISNEKISSIIREYEFDPTEYSLSPEIIQTVNHKKIPNNLIEEYDLSPENIKIKQSVKKPVKPVKPVKLVKPVKPVKPVKLVKPVKPVNEEYDLSPENIKIKQSVKKPVKQVKPVKPVKEEYDLSPETVKYIKQSVKKPVKPVKQVEEYNLSPENMKTKKVKQIRRPRQPIVKNEPIIFEYDLD